MEKRVITLILVCATTNAGVHMTYVTNPVFKEREPKAILNYQILMVSHELWSQAENMAKTDLIFFKEEIEFLEVYFNPLITVFCTSHSLGVKEVGTYFNWAVESGGKFYRKLIKIINLQERVGYDWFYTS